MTGKPYTLSYVAQVHAVAVKHAMAATIVRLMGLELLIRSLIACGKRASSTSGSQACLSPSSLTSGWGQHIQTPRASSAPSFEQACEA